MSDLNPLGHEIGRLPHSRESDIAANREARFSWRQLLRLLNSAFWRLLFGLPLAAFGVLLAFSVTHWFFILVGLLAVGFGAYLAWRGFSFLAVRWRSRLYTNDLYLHQEGQLWEMIISGIAVTVASGATFTGGAWVIYYLRKHPAKPLPSLPVPA